MEPSECLDFEGNASELIGLPIANGPATGYAWQLDLPAGVVRIEEDAKGRPHETENKVCLALGMAPARRLNDTSGKGIPMTIHQNSERILVLLQIPPGQRTAPFQQLQRASGCPSPEAFA